MMPRYQVYFQDDNGDTVGRVHYVSAGSVTLALKMFNAMAFPRRVHSAVVREIDGPGWRVPLWHESPKWAPSSEWDDVQ